MGRVKQVSIGLQEAQEEWIAGGKELRGAGKIQVDFLATPATNIFGKEGHLFRAYLDEVPRVGDRIRDMTVAKYYQVEHVTHHIHPAWEPRERKRDGEMGIEKGGYGVAYIGVTLRAL